MSDHLQRIADVFQLGRKLEIIDVGASPLDGPPAYQSLVDSGLANVTGFEPQPIAFAELEKSPKPGTRYLPQALGDGNLHKLNLCKAPGMTSILEPDFATLALFDFLRPLAEVVDTLPVQTARLDDVHDIETADLLKLDVQGAELMILEHGKGVLDRCAAVHLEVSFLPLYVGQPTIGDVDRFMRAQGFVPHCFAELKRWVIAPCVVNNDPRIPMNQLLEADLVYVRDFRDPDALAIDKIKAMAILAVVAYGSIDLALRCAVMLEQRGALAKGAEERFLTAVTTTQAK